MPLDLRITTNVTWTGLIATNSSGPGLQRETEVPALCGAC